MYSMKIINVTRFTIINDIIRTLFGELMGSQNPWVHFRIKNH